MVLNWETFKTNLGVSSNTSVFYFDEEGSKIPIDSECEFQEALRLAKLHKSNLKLVFCGDKLKPNETMLEVKWDAVQPVTNPKEKWSDVKNGSAISQNCSWKENKCNCNGDLPPKWFRSYMKKFKKEIFHELKSYIHDTVHSAIDKKLSKPERCELFCERNEHPISSVGTKKKKKTSERDLMDLMDQRQVNLPKKLNATEPEQLETLDQKTKALLEETRRVLERKYHLISKSEENCFVNKNIPKKSASFPANDLCLTMQRDSDFAVIIAVQNNGLQPWNSPELVCFELKGMSLCLWDYTKKLPKLSPEESCFVTVRGTLSSAEDEFPRYFKCKVVDLKVENISPVFTCRFDVVPKNLVKESDEVATQLRDTVGTLIDFEKDLITSSQKKIEENITEIERRLRDIDLLQPSTSSRKEVKEEENGCDLIQLDGKVVQGDVKSEAAMNGLCSLKNDTQKEKNEDKIKKDGELDSSDSELSIVFMSEDDEIEREEEEDNFFVVPSESLSTTESANEEKHSSDSTVREKTAEKQSKETEEKQETPREIRKDEVTPSETFHLSPTRCRCSPFGEEISKPKKMKSKSTEYRFTAANLTQPTFTQIPGFFEGRPSRFTFTGEKDVKGSQGVKKRVLETDSLGRVIYAVNSKGWCFPVEDLFKRVEESELNQPGGSQESQNGQERRHDRVNDFSPVNNIPNALINGASNAASLAFNTAKSVINNLQSVFVTEGKTEMGEPAYEDKVIPSMEALFKLYEMGYMDIERNRVLLVLHNNNVNKVVDELVRLSENPSEGSV